jgi:hypothetical protein
VRTLRFVGAVRARYEARGQALLGAGALGQALDAHPLGMVALLRLPFLANGALNYSSKTGKLSADPASAIKVKTPEFKAEDFQRILDGSPAPSWSLERLFALFPNLGEMPQRLGGRMSGGEQQMLTVARTLMGNPFLVLLDEPSEGVAPVIVEQMVQMILELKTQGVSILLSEQNMHFAELVSDRAYVLEKGQLRFEGSMAELAANETVRRDYLSV